MRGFMYNLISNYASFYIPDITITDVIEVLILAYIIYKLILWLMDTKAWTLLKGIVVLVGFIAIAALFNMQTILFIVKNCLSIVAVASVVVFQPELRRALEKLGEKDFLSNIVQFDTSRESARFTEETREALINACFAMGKVKTGALIVIEQKTKLTEYEKTGIRLDCLISRQVLINIFEHNTPLHDGAIIVQGDRIESATCYLPLSDNMNLSKDLGTRHRAAVGITEVSDAMVLVVSEETGAVSVAKSGKLYRNLGQKELRKKLIEIQDIPQEKEKTMKVMDWLKGSVKNERKTSENKTDE